MSSFVSTTRLSIACGLLLPILLVVAHAQRQASEPRAPAANAAVLSLLDDGAAAVRRGEARTGLELADRALDLARQSNDASGEAQAHRLRALVLMRLDRADDARAAWREAETTAKRIEYTPGQIEAIGHQAVLEPVANATQRAALIQQAFALAETETVRPKAAISNLDDVGRALHDRGLLTDAMRVYEKVVAIAERVAPDSLELASGFHGIGLVATAQRNLDTAEGYFLRALAIEERLAPTTLATAASLSGLGAIKFQRGDYPSAREYSQRDLAIREKLAPNSIGVANVLDNLGVVSWRQGDLAAAADYFARSGAIVEKIAPDSLSLANNLNNLGLLYVDRGDLTAARDCFQRALAIREKRAPDSLSVANSLGSMALLSSNEGDLETARDYNRRALAMKERLVPDSLDVAGTLNSLADNEFKRGELGVAYELHHRALAIRQRRSPGTLAEATSLHNLGVLANEQGDRDAAAEYYQRAFAIREKQAPDSLEAASTLNNIASLASARNDLDAALLSYKRALSIAEKQAPSSSLVATILGNLGYNSLRRGDIAAAQSFHERALAIREKVAPASLDVAASLGGLGVVAKRQGERDTARDYFEKALRITERLAPNSLEVTRALNELGRLAYDEGRFAAAADYTGRAWSIIRSQALLVGSDEARQAFESAFHATGSRLVRIQIALGNTDDAFGTLEDGRAQALLQTLASRGLARRLASPEKWQRYSVAQATADREGKALEKAGNAETAARSSLDAELAQLSSATVVDEHRRILAAREQETQRARQAYTRARIEAELHWSEVRKTIEAAIPPALTAADARRALPQDSVLAAFAVADAGVTLFIVEHDRPVRAFPLEIPLSELTARVDFVRRSFSRNAGSRDGLALPSNDIRIDSARTLFRKLFPPDAREAIAAAARVLISPDDVLWDLPFAALIVNEGGEPRYLGLEKPLVYTQSLAAFAQTNVARASTSTAAGARRNVLVVGNPLYDRAQLGAGKPLDAGASSNVTTPGRRATGELALLSRDAEIPIPLPHAEVEARRVATLYGVRAAVGVEPTEAWFRQRAAMADIIHLATHGYFNPFRAVASGIRLAVPEQAPSAGETDNDGALQAWEVISQLQLRADLVVLSACETGVGAKVAGEGLVGLTRAFQVAGARSVVATQWKVADQSTASAMVAFHQQLQRGVPKDEALRQAVRLLATDPQTRDPYYWAAFMLIGDYRPLRAAARR